MRVVLSTLAIFLFACATPAGAQQKSFRLAVAESLIANGALKYLLPRFSLKTGIKVRIVPLADAGGADAALGVFASPLAGAEAIDVFRGIVGGEHYSLAIRQTEATPFAERFRDWLTSKIGERTVGKFSIDGAPVYAAIEVEVVAEVAAMPEGDADLGEKIAIRRCGRCHVISDKNRFGGIDSTPSFGALRTLPHWRQRFETFWTLNPHPSFTQIEGLTEPFDPARPPAIAPLVLTQDDLEAILAFVIRMKPKDLGAALISQ